tara:strand:- start:419 stop:1129 length:711 start_codon:yes stop_codon:yes gene_type:complete
MRPVKILLKVVIGLILLGLLLFGTLFIIYDQPLPQGETGAAANALAQKMLTALHYDQYQATRFLEWSYIGGKHRYKWDKENGIVQVAWKRYKVDLDLNKSDRSKVFRNGSAVIGDDRSELIEKAQAFFNNDSFWLVAPFKVFDKGAERRLIVLKDGSQGLLITYRSGGTTPGDSYLWKLGADGFPKSFQLWVKIIPIGGLEASWDDWKEMENGLSLPGSHRLGPITLYMGHVRAYN